VEGKELLGMNYRNWVGAGVGMIVGIVLGIMIGMHYPNHRFEATKAMDIRFDTRTAQNCWAGTANEQETEDAATNQPNSSDFPLCSGL
jgi:hypothetical protein